MLWIEVLRDDWPSRLYFHSAIPKEKMEMTMQSASTICILAQVLIGGTIRNYMATKERFSFLSLQRKAVSWWKKINGIK
jgi:hypothetical protein